MNKGKLFEKLFVASLYGTTAKDHKVFQSIVSNLARLLFEHPLR